MSELISSVEVLVQRYTIACSALDIMAAKYRQLQLGYDRLSDGVKRGFTHASRAKDAGTGHSQDSRQAKALLAALIPDA